MIAHATSYRLGPYPSHKKISVLKAFRKHYGMGLSEAKQAIESLDYVFNSTALAEELESMGVQVWKENPKINLFVAIAMWLDPNGTEWDVRTQSGATKEEAREALMASLAVRPPPAPYAIRFLHSTVATPDLEEPISEATEVEGDPDV